MRAMTTGGDRTSGVLGSGLELRVDPEPVRPGHAVALGVGDDEAQRLFGFVRRLGLSDAQADDAVQEVLTRLLEQRQRGVVIANPQAWAFQAAYRLAMDQHRLRRRLAASRDVARAARRSPGRDFDTADRVAVWGEVDRLPERQRAVIYLRYRADLQFDEIGEAMGISASAARSHATQATATLRERLATRVEERA